MWRGSVRTPTSGSVTRPTLAEEREAVELAFVATLQHLPGNQRAALLLFDVVGFTAAEIAAIMDTSVASINSALQRARSMVAARIPSRTQQATVRDIGDARLREIVRGYAQALETRRRRDAGRPAHRATSPGRCRHCLTGTADWPRSRTSPSRCRSRAARGSTGATSANGQPAIGCYLWNQERKSYLAWSINVLTLRDGLVASITSFIGTEHFELLGLPTRLT